MLNKLHVFLWPVRTSLSHSRYTALVKHTTAQWMCQRGFRFIKHPLCLLVLWLMVAIVRRLWQQRSWLGASDSTWLYPPSSLSVSVPPPVRLSFSLWSSASFHFLLCCYLFTRFSFPLFPLFASRLSFPFVLFLQHSSTFNIARIDFLISTAALHSSLS